MKYTSVKDIRPMKYIWCISVKGTCIDTSCFVAGIAGMYVRGVYFVGVYFVDLTGVEIERLWPEGEFQG